MPNAAGGAWMRAAGLAPRESGKSFMLRLCPVSRDGSAMRNVPVRRAARIAHADGFATFMSQEHRRCHRRCNTLLYFGTSSSGSMPADS
jgi:hypothetical protein